MAQRHVIKHEHLTRGSKNLPPLMLGDKVMIQDQSTHKPGRWTQTGTVVEVQEYDSYLIKVDGSNKATKRNRKFLRKLVTYNEVLNGPADIKSTPPSPADSPPTPAPLAPKPPVPTHAKSTSTPAPPCVPPVTLRKKEDNWVIINPVTSENKPPPPGSKHNYEVMKQKAQMQRDLTRASVMR